MDEHGLDYKIIPPRKPEYHRLWELTFRDRLINSLEDLRETKYQHALMHAPTHLDWQFGSAGFNVFESIYWENGFFQTARLRIRMLNLIRCRYSSNTAMVYPNEGTDGNRVFDSTFWLTTCAELKKKKYNIVLIGDTRHPPLREFYRHCPADKVYDPTVNNLISCMENSCLALGGSTGPTWACLLSDIPQIVFESKRSPHGYWFFDRCKRVLEKDIKILTTLECLLS